MANTFTASGNVIPATGNITFNSNAASNAVRQVFGGGVISNMVGLVNSNVDVGTRPPPFAVASTVPTAASGNLKLSFFAGKSLFLTAPTTYNIGTITNSSVNPTLSGGSGTSYLIAIGSAAGGTTLTNGWVAATSGTAITKQTGGVTNLSFTTGTNYYISAHASNATKGTSSLAVSNTSAYGIPNVATGVTLTITSLTAWSMSWTAPSIGIAPTGYSWSISTSSTVSNTTAGYFGTTTAPTVSASGTAALTGGTTYYALIYATRPESISALAASAGVLSLSAPASFTITSMTTTVVNFSWTAVSGASSYTLTYSGTSGGTVTGITGSTYAWTHGFANGGWTCTLAAVAGGTGPSSGAAYFGLFTSPTTGTTYTPPAAKSYTVTVVGAGGGIATDNYRSTAGSGAIIRAVGTLAVTAYTVQVGGAGGSTSGQAGTNGGGAGGATALPPPYAPGPYAGGGGGFSQFGARGGALSLTAGGGGGGSYSSGGMVDDNSAESYAVGNGGNAGVTTTNNGTAGQTTSITNSYVCGCPPTNPTSSATANGGGGGTQSAAGAGGSGGVAGSSSTGGAGGGGYQNYGGYKSAAGGGGGGGYFGGGGGGWNIQNIFGYNSGESVASGGGGGSSFKGGSFGADSSSGSGGAAAGVNGWVLIYG